MPAKRKPSKPSPKRAAKAETPKRGKGRPEFKPTAEQRNMVQVMSGYGIPQDKIACLIINPETSAGISEVTLRKVFHKEIQAPCSRTPPRKRTSSPRYSWPSPATGTGTGTASRST